MSTMIDISKGIITDVYLSPPKGDYPARLYATILTDDSNMRFSFVDVQEETLRSVSLTPCKIQAKMVVRKVGTGEIRELHRPLIKPVIPASDIPK